VPYGYKTAKALMQAQVVMLPLQLRLSINHTVALLGLSRDRATDPACVKLRGFATRARLRPRSPWTDSR
jgi:hypothetical protein